MLYRFVILSDEVDNFIREITLDTEATFFDFHNALLDAVNYSKDQMTSFFICSDDWEKEQEVTLFEMDSSSEYDNLVMAETGLSELLADEGQKLLYVFDYLMDRAFFIELKEIIPGKYLDAPQCTLSKGLAPMQLMEEEELLTVAPITAPVNVDAAFYGDEGFELDELDEEGYSDLNVGDEPAVSEEPNF